MWDSPAIQHYHLGMVKETHKDLDFDGFHSLPNLHPKNPTIFWVKSPRKNPQNSHRKIRIYPSHRFWCKSDTEIEMVYLSLSQTVSFFGDFSQTKRFTQKWPKDSPFHNSNKKKKAPRAASSPLEPLDLPFPGLKGRRNWRPNDPYGFN